MLSQFQSKYGRNGLFFDGASEGSGGDGAGDQNDWKAKFLELQNKIRDEYVLKTSYATLQTNLQTAVEEKKTVVMERDTALSSAQTLEALKGTLENEVGLLKTTIGTKEAELGTAKNKLERHNIILTQFPGLAALEAEGLLPAVEVSELPEKLKKFQEAWNNQSSKKKDDFREGTGEVVPPKKNDGLTRTAADVQKEMYAASMAGKQPEYEKLRVEHQGLLKSESAAK